VLHCPSPTSTQSYCCLPRVSFATHRLAEDVHLVGVVVAAGAIPWPVVTLDLPRQRSTGSAVKTILVHRYSAYTVSASFSEVLGALPPVDFRAVCLVRAIRLPWDKRTEKLRSVEPPLIRIQGQVTRVTRTGIPSLLPNGG
jgi:hypothetical protein